MLAPVAAPDTDSDSHGEQAIRATIYALLLV